MNWTTNVNGTILITLGVNHYAQIELGETRWQAYIGRLAAHPEGYGPTRFEKWGVACEFDTYSDAKIWCEGRINASANVAKR